VAEDMPGRAGRGVAAGRVGPRRLRGWAKRDVVARKVVMQPFNPPLIPIPYGAARATQGWRAGHFGRFLAVRRVRE